MSTILVSSDKKHYVLSLSLEEAQLLGTFQFKHLAGDCPLFKVLRGLPFLTAAEFCTETAFGNKPIFHDIVPNPGTSNTHKIIDRSCSVERHLDHMIAEDFAALEALAWPGRPVRSPLLQPSLLFARQHQRPTQAPQSLGIPYARWRIECNFGVHGSTAEWGPSQNSGVADATFATKEEAEAALKKQSWFSEEKYGHQYRAAPVPREQKLRRLPAPPAPAPINAEPRWIVQYQMSGGEWMWVKNSDIRGDKYPGEQVYSSRNEAYRQLRKRAAAFGKDTSEYRVVPQNTPDGPEKDRGYYIVEHWSRHYREWRVTSGGPGAGNNSDCGRYKTAEAASRDIRTCGYGNTTYRVKWRPSKA